MPNALTDNLVGWTDIANALVGYYGGGNSGGVGPNAGYGDKPNGTAKDMFDAALSGAGVVFGGPLGIAHLGAMAINGQPPSLSNTASVVKGIFSGPTTTPAPLTIGAFSDSQADPSGLSGGRIDAPGAGFGTGSLGGTLGGALNGIGDITGGGNTMGGRDQEVSSSLGSDATYREGGYTGDGPVDQDAGDVHGQEFVLSAPAVKALGLPFLTALNEHAAAMIDPRNAADRMRMAQRWGGNGLVR